MHDTGLPNTYGRYVFKSFNDYCTHWLCFGCLICLWSLFSVNWGEVTYNQHQEPLVFNRILNEMLEWLAMIFRQRFSNGVHCPSSTRETHNVLSFDTFLIYITTSKVKGVVSLKCIACLTQTVVKVVNNWHSPFLIKINTLCRVPCWCNCIKNGIKNICCPCWDAKFSEHFRLVDVDSLVSNYLTLYFVFDQAEFLLYVTCYKIHEKIKLLSDKHNVQNNYGF